MTTVPPAQTSLRIPWNPALEGVRGIAVLLVLLYHFLSGGDPNRGMRSLHLKVAAAGWLGVDLFFVLSGYLITTILLSSKEDPHYFRNFYERRVRRIFPLYYAVLLIMLVIIPAFVGQRTPALTRMLRDQWMFWFYLSNFLSHPIGVEWLQIGHFWSLAIEEQFYLVWPAVVFRLDRLRAARVAFGAMVFSILLRGGLDLVAALWPALSATAGHGAFAWTPCRLDSLGVGALIALLNRDAPARERLRLLGRRIGVILVPCLGYIVWRGWARDIFSPAGHVGLRILSDSIYTIFAIAFGCLIVECISGSSWVTRIAATAPLRFFGKYSYGIYVYQGLLEPWLRRWFSTEGFSRHFGSGEAARLAFFVLSSMVIVSIAVVSWHGYERRFLKAAKPRTAIVND
jgi:peptidoglycan/LPS O-acetylase OafA/YrhL